MKYLPIYFNNESILCEKYLSLKIKDLIDIIFSHNEIIELCMHRRKEEKPYLEYSETIWRGHAHELPAEYENYTFLRIFGCIGESIVNSDTIYIECDIPKNFNERLVEFDVESDYNNNNTKDMEVNHATREDN